MFAGLKDFFFGNGKASNTLARSRLHFVLVQDRTGLSPDDMTKFKREMVEVLERYFVIDENGFDVAYKRDSDLTTLVINSPVIVRRQDAVGAQVGARTKDRRPMRSRNHDGHSSGKAKKSDESSTDVAEEVTASNS